ncbi:MAG: hypothetical protein Q7J54_03310 [Candidatus Woesearchaeota archaeon]|nr:hypothetical protein [Candidatus Woesearchaeota archaeon]
MKQDIVVFDVLGPIYQYAEVNGRLENCIPFAYEKIKELHPEEYERAKNDFAFAAEMEFRLFKEGAITCIATPFAVDTLLYLKEKGIMPVVASAGTDETLRFTLDTIVDNYNRQNGTKLVANEVIPYKNLISTSPIGSKKDPKTWQTAVYDNFGANNRILLGYEDSINNCLALANGLNCTGLHIVSENCNLSIVQYNPTIIRGTMEQHYKMLRGG